VIPDLPINQVNLRVVVGGSGPTEPELKDLVKQNKLEDVVEFPGQIEWNQVPEFLSASDIFVLPSQRDKAGNVDGLPTVLLEAMSCGLACIATDVGGVNLVIKNELNGILIEPSDSKQLSKRLSELVMDEELRKSLGYQSRLSIIQQYNWKVVSLELEKIFSKVLNKTNNNRLGQFYRVAYLKKLNMAFGGEKVLDIGCRDDEWLAQLEADLKVGLDLSPVKSTRSISMIKANANILPFLPNSFDVIYLLDVLEHIPEDNKLIDRIMKILKPGGKLILTTPNIDINIFPPFLTRWVSKKWGHTFRVGYDPKNLLSYFSDETEIKVFELNAYLYRNIYLPLRLTFSLFPQLTKKIVSFIVNQEMKKPFGNKGFLLMVATKK
jgi:2-polyprenyl-3-methyl-5-hydroxy-6-metoxy-1,4-benzoquinol methylase